MVKYILFLPPSKMAAQPKYVLIAGTEEDKDMVAKLKANLEDKEKEAKKANDDKEKVEARLKAIEEEDKVEHAKKAIKAVLDDEDSSDEDKVKAKKAMTDIFDTGNGTNTNAQETDKEKEQTAVIASLTADASKPLITKILIAQKYNGADEKSLKTTKEQLEKLDYSSLKGRFESDKIYINKALSAKSISQTGESLEAKIESDLDFNGGEGFSLTGKTIDLDEAMGHSS